VGYEVALNKAWEELAGLAGQKDLAVKFLADEYNIDLGNRKVYSLSCNVAAKDFTAILILHYLIKRINGLPEPSGQWLSFRELSGIEGYGPAFRKRAIEPVIRKYGVNPKGLFTALEHLPAKKAQSADASIVVEAFGGVPVLVELWAQDEELSPEASMLFDRSITRIFPTEDIVVLAGLIAGAL